MKYAVNDYTVKFGLKIYIICFRILPHPFYADYYVTGNCFSFCVVGITIEAPTPTPSPPPHRCNPRSCPEDDEGTLRRESS